MDGGMDSRLNEAIFSNISYNNNKIKYITFILI